MRSAGIKVADVDALVAKLKEMGVAVMSQDARLWVEHDNASVKDATLAAVTAASGRSGEVHLSWLQEIGCCKAVADEAAKIAGVGKVHLADDAAYANHGLAENVAPLVAEPDGQPRRLRRARHHAPARTSPRASPRCSM